MPGSQPPDHEDGTIDWSTPKNQVILQSLVDPDYSEHRAKRLDILDSLIRKGEAVEEAKAMREIILKETPESPLIDPSEPPGLDMLVYQRIEVLKILRAEPSPYPKDVENIDAVLEAYREGYLEVKRGMVSYWRRGLMVRSLGPPLDDEELLDKFCDWSMDGAEKGIWVEEALVPPQLQTTKAICLCSQNGLHHATPERHASVENEEEKYKSGPSRLDTNGTDALEPEN